MKDTRYETDHRLLWRIFFVIYGVLWFLPVMGDKSGLVRPVAFLWMLIKAVVDGEVSALREIMWPSMWLLAYVSLLYIPSMLAAWLIQCAVVVLRERRKLKSKDTA